MVTLLPLAVLLAAHPLHSSSAQVRLPEGPGVLEVVIRVFTADFPPGSDRSAASRYFANRFRITAPGGQPVALAIREVRVEGSVLVWSLAGTVTAGLRGGLIWNGILAERFDDQVNLVQIRQANRNTTLLFSAGDSAQPIP
jgi:hypothetical protein